MLIYRLAPTAYAADLSGEGSRLFGGRWNQPGIACVYASASRALALLEFTVNSNVDELPGALSMVTIRIPDDSVHAVPVRDLPRNWKQYPAPDSTRQFGSELIRSLRYPVIQLPSAVLPAEFNYILVPAHERASEFRIVEISEFVFDKRIKR